MTTDICNIFRKEKLQKDIKSRKRRKITKRVGSWLDGQKLEKVVCNRQKTIQTRT
jgi:hypothetical protein